MGFKFKHRKVKSLFFAFDQGDNQTCSVLDCSSNCTTQCLQTCPSYCENSGNVSYPPPPPPTSKPSLRQPAVTVACLALIFLGFGLYTAHREYHRRNRTILLQNTEPSQPEQGQLEEAEQGYIEDTPEAVDVHLAWIIETTGLPQGVVDKITVFKYSKNQGLVEGADCSVCLGEFDEDDILKLLPNCDHAFHIQCIDTWLRSHTNCPLCRTMIVLDPSRDLTVEQHVESPGNLEDLYQRVSEEEGINRDGGESPSHQLQSASTEMAQQELSGSNESAKACIVEPEGCVNCDSGRDWGHNKGPSSCTRILMGSPIVARNN